MYYLRLEFPSLLIACFLASICADFQAKRPGYLLSFVPVLALALPGPPPPVASIYTKNQAKRPKYLHLPCSWPWPFLCASSSDWPHRGLQSVSLEVASPGTINK